MDQLLPVLVGRIEEAGDVVAVIQAALRGGIAFVQLDEPPAAGGTHALELHIPGWQRPLVLLGEPAGEPLDTEFPLLLAPYAEAHRAELTALLARIEGGAPAPPPAPAPEAEGPSPGPVAGRVLGGGKYAILAELGRGGMGSVYRARHVMLDKVIAVKVLHPSHRHSEQFLAAFHREALAASRLDHPNVVRVLDFGREPDGLLYIAMEMLEGRDLRAILEEQPVQPLGRIVDVMGQVAAALSASHEQGIIHRDVKPENIFVVPRRDDDGTPREMVKVLDFGIAELHEGGRAAKTGPRTGLTGTPDYMSPEQIRREVLDARADIYACGVIVFEMACGKVPFYSADTPEQIARMHVSLEPPRPSSLQANVDRGLEALILKALDKDPARRQQSARELRAELRAVLEAQGPRQASVAPGAGARAPAAAISSTALAPGRAVARPVDADDDMHFIPVGAMPSFQRDDAIDIGDLLGGRGGGLSAGGVKEQAWVLGEQLSTALIHDPAGSMARIEAVVDLAAFAQEMAALERALASLLTRGAAAPIAVVVSRLLQAAQGSPPGDGSRSALAARALHSIVTPEMLVPLANAAFDGAPADRDAARWVLLQLGPTGAHALCAARVRASAHGASWPGRPRFVAAMRELASSPAGAALALRTLETFLQQADRRDVSLVEDLLRAIPEVPDERLGALIGSRELRHDAPSVRRAAVAALASTWGPRGNAWFAPLLEDPDEGVRVAAVAALRRHGGVDRDLVQRIGRLLGGSTLGPDGRLAAVAALGDARGPARTAAAEILAQAMHATGGFLGKLMAVESRSDDAVVVAMARVLLAITGPEAARLIEARAAKSTADLRRELMALIGGGASMR